MDSPAPATVIISRQYGELPDSARQQQRVGINFPVVPHKILRTIQPGEWLLVRLNDRPGLFLLEMLDNKFTRRATSSALFGLADRQRATTLELSDIRRIKRCPALAPTSTRLLAHPTHG